jgi:tetratricopeptide (TPR) repeat protein
LPLFGLVALLSVSPAEAQDAPGAEAKSEKPADLFRQAYELSKAAKTDEEASKIIDLCQQGLAGNVGDKDKQYGNNLLSWAYNKRGETRAEAGQEDEALADFEQSIKLDPSRWLALHNRGVSYGMLGNLDAALADFNRVIQLNPNFVKALYNRGELRFKKGDLNGAIADYTAVIRLEPQDSGALTSRGFAHYSRGDYRNAVQDYNRAIQINPNNAEALTLRGDAQADQARFDQAVADYQLAVKANPDYGRVYQSSAWLRATCPVAQFRNTAVALRNAQKAIDLDGENDHRYLESLAAAQANAGEFNDAKATQARAIEAAKSANVSQQAAGRMSERLKLYESGQPYRDVRPGQPQPRQ